MITPTTLTLERLKSLLHYNPETGEFTWIAVTTNRVHVGRKAGVYHPPRGYFVISIDGRKYMAHRLAYMYMTGEYPDCEIDHINGDRADNRFTNLRKATASDQRQNQGLAKNNTSGVQNVYWSKERSKWYAKVGCAYKTFTRGYFDTVADAVNARDELKEKLHQFNPIAATRESFARMAGAHE